MDSLHHQSLADRIITYANSTEDEICGVVLNDSIFIPVENIAEDKRNHFLIDDLEITKHENITAFVHSHSKGYPFLSKADFLAQRSFAVAFWLVCDSQIFKFRSVEPLIGREFEHGVTDCYTLFRDIYHLCKIEMPNFDRQDDWWFGGNLYLDNMEKTGFYQVNDVQIGDVILVNLGARVPNHAMIYLGNNQVIHHCPKRLSKRDLYDGYWLKHTHSIWRNKEWQSSNFTAVLNNLEINTR